MRTLLFRQQPAADRRATVTAIVLALTSWLVTTSWCLADDPPKLRRTWHEMQTPNFVLLGDASKQQMQAVAESMESLRAFLGRIVQDTAPDPMPTFVYVFRSEHSYEPYAPRQTDGTPLGVLGFSARRPHAHYIALDASVPQALAGRPLHDVVDAFTERRLPTVPLWFREGLAELYSTFEADEGHAFVGRIVDRHLDGLQTGPMIPLFDFLSVSTWSPELYDEGRRDGPFYAQSWLLVHYLFVEAEEGPAKLIRYLELDDEMPRAEAFRTAFGMEPAAMEQALRDYLRSRRFSFRRVEAPIGDLSDQIRTRKMSRAEALARLGELLAMQDVPRFDEADAHLRAALAMEPDLVAGHVGLGLLRMDAADWPDDAMVDHFRKAQALAPEDRTIAFLLALARARTGETGTELRNDLIRLVQDAPRHLNAWRLLTWAWAGEPEPLDRAIRVFEGARAMMPDDWIYAEHLVRLYRAADRAEDAEGLIRSFFEPRNMEPVHAEETLPRPGPPYLPLAPF